MQLLKSRPFAALLLAVVFGLPVSSQTVNQAPVVTEKAFSYQIVKQKNVQKQAVASAHPLASDVGNQIMAMGGNAFDAAVATQFALAVVYPNAGNLGGGGFLLARTADGKTTAIDYREMAPSKASRDMYIDSNGVAQTNLSQYGHLASGVPGTIAGIAATMPMAKLPLQKLIEPAIQLAKKGFVITESEANNLNETKPEFLQHNTRPTAFVKPNNGQWKQGDTLVQPELAATLIRIQKYGLQEFYTGKTADLIVAEMQRGKGIITKADLKAYKPVTRQALTVNYRNHEVICFPPPSSGGLLLAQMLQMIEPYPISTWGFHNPKTVQLMVEVERRAYADRAAHMGDPDYYKVPVKTLVSKPYLEKRMATFIPGKATPSAAIPAGDINPSEETTHISIVDKHGNCVSVTTTLNGSYGSKTVVGGAGFLLNNEMDDFSIKPGTPNMYGAVGGEANAILPRKRMLSSMCPTIVLKNNQPFMVVGTPGGTTIPTSVFQSIVNVIDFNMDAATAIAKPKFHHQWLPDEIHVEKSFDPALRDALTTMGYTIKTRRAIGRVELILFNKNGTKDVAADIRGDDSVAGQ